jgi:hypothetical protein
MGKHKEMNANKTDRYKLLMNSESNNKRLIVGMAISLLKKDIPSQITDPFAISYYTSRLEHLSRVFATNETCYFDLAYCQSLLAILTSFRNGYMRLDPLLYGISTEHTERQVLYAEVEANLKNFADELQ